MRYEYVDNWAHFKKALRETLPSICMYPLIVTMQRLDKHVVPATNTHNNKRIIGHVFFYVGCIRMIGDYFFRDVLDSVIMNCIFLNDSLTQLFFLPHSTKEIITFKFNGLKSTNHLKYLNIFCYFPVIPKIVKYDVLWFIFLIVLGVSHTFYWNQ
jgi:hypothetical protein